MSEPFLGEIRIFGGTYAPLDWAFCDGQSLAIAQYDALYSLVGTTYGGDGMSSFNLPDLRGRVPMHRGNGYNLGEKGGQETVTLQANQVAAHTHAVRAKEGNGNANTPEGNVWATIPSEKRYSTATPALAMRSTTVSTGGGNGAAHDNMMPFLVINFIICLYGLYPQRS